LKRRTFASPRLTKRYNTAKRGELLALRNVSLDAARGEFIGIVEPSGCGELRLGQRLDVAVLGSD